MLSKMNHAQTLASVVLALASFAVSCQRQPQKVDAQPQPSPTADWKAKVAPSPITNKPYPGTGIVKFINRKEGWIQINHEPIADIMPAMEMEWFVQKKSLLDNIVVGDKVNFTMVDTGRAQIITEVKRVSEQKK